MPLSTLHPAMFALRSSPPYDEDPTKTTMTAAQAVVAPTSITKSSLVQVAVARTKSSVDTLAVTSMVTRSLCSTMRRMGAISRPGLTCYSRQEQLAQNQGGFLFLS